MPSDGVVEKNMDFAEFWVLETAVRSCISLETIGGGDRYLRFQWNKPPHGLSHAELVGLMERLLDAGYVECYMDCSPVARPTASEVSTAIAARGQMPDVSEKLGYCLTAAGAAVWEQIAKPDWGRYMNDQWDFDEEGDGGHLEIAVGSSQMLDYVLEHGPCYWEITIAGGAKDRSVLKPWEATYWKTLPEGHKAILSFKRGFPPEIEKLRRELPEVEFQARRRKLLKEFGRWYQDPF
jgi:hypothetical protein